jgi:ABC-type nitrate/sulfonate/bicarbonate transport system ATPase subunit
MAEIVLDHVTKRFPGGTMAVDDANLDVADGEFAILVGPSGSGKSTLLNMIAGLEDISEGEIRIGDRVVNTLSPKDRDIAMVFQDYALYPHMTVRENMGFSLKLAHVDRAEIDRKVHHAAELLELTQLLDRKPANLSGGQRQRVAMGRAIVRSPQAFLMDEPLSNLDAKLRVQTRTTLARLQNQLGTTTVYVTHDQIEAMTEVPPLSRRLSNLVHLGQGGSFRWQHRASTRSSCASGPSGCGGLSSRAGRSPTSPVSSASTPRSFGPGSAATRPTMASEPIHRPPPSVRSCSGCAGGWWNWNGPTRSCGRRAPISPRSSTRPGDGHELRGRAS